MSITNQYIYDSLEHILEHILEVSSKLGSIQQFCEFCEEIHKITKCNNDDCSIGIYTNLIRNVFNPELNYDYRRIFFVKKLVGYPKVFKSMFRLQNQGIEKVKSFENSNHSPPPPPPL